MGKGMSSIWVVERRKRASPAPAGGFTLIETVFAIMIILIAVVGLFAIFTNAVAPSNAPQPYEIAVGIQYMQEGLERVYADRRNLSRGFSYITPANYPNENLGAGYSRTTTIGAWPVDTDTATYVQVTVQVSHNGRTVAQGATLMANYTWN